MLSLVYGCSLPTAENPSKKTPLSESSAKPKEKEEPRGVWKIIEMLGIKDSPRKDCTNGNCLQTPARNQNKESLKQSEETLVPRYCDWVYDKQLRVQICK